MMDTKRNITKLLAISILVTLLLTLLPTPAAQAEEHKWGDWVIEGDETVEGETIIVHGDAIVTNIT